MEFPRRRFGYHIVYDRDIYDALDYASNHGFGYIVPDLMIPRYWPENYPEAERRRMREYAESQNVGVSFHSPADNLSLLTAYPEVRGAIIERMRLCLEFTKDFGAERFTIHPAEPRRFASDGREGTYHTTHREFYRQAIMENIGRIVKEAGAVKVCVENDPITPFVEETLEGLLGSIPLFLTLDAPKAQEPEKGDPGRVEAFYLRHHDLVQEVHLHDRKPSGMYHDVLGRGSLDVAKYINRYRDSDVCFTLEIRPRESAEKSLRLIEKIWSEAD
jgi:sugar phosphate isomerase/epimerase